MNAPLANDLRIAARVLDAMRQAGIDPETDEDAAELLSAECDIQERLVRMLRAARREEAEAKGIAGLIEELKNRAFRRETKALRLRGIVLDAMSDLGLPKLQAPDFTASVGKGRERVVIADEAAIPEHYCRITKAPSLTLIREAFDRGGIVPGAERANPQPVLTIRSR